MFLTNQKYVDWYIYQHADWLTISASGPSVLKRLMSALLFQFYSLGSRSVHDLTLNPLRKQKNQAAAKSHHQAPQEGSHWL